MRGKFTTKTIIIAIIALLVLAAAVTGTVVFLKDSGEAAAAQEQELLDAIQKEESQDKSDDTTKEEQNLPELGDEEDRTNQSNVGNGNSTNTNNDREDSDTLEEPAPSTVEREKVVSETTTLGWDNIGLNSTIGANELGIVYNNLEYKVEYYFDEILDEELSDTIGENSKGKVIDTYEDKVKVGYELDKVENLPLTITENEKENVIKVLYVKDDEQTKELSYTVKYFIEEVEQKADEKVITETVWINAEEIMTFDSSLLNKEYVGYKKVKTNPETVGTTVNNKDVIEVYYEKDEDQVKDISYTVKYFIEDQEQESDSKVVTETVWVNDKEEMTFDVSLLNKEYVGYKKVRTNPETVGSTVNNGDVIEVYYEKDEEQVKEISYTVKYFIENKEQESDRKVITQTVWVNDKEEMTFDSSLLDKEYTGYMQVGTNPETIGETVNNGDVIEVYYEKDEEQVKEISYTVKYFVENKEQESDRKVVTETVWVNDKEEMTFDSSLLDKEYVGYKKVRTNPETVGTTVNNKDVIEVYYEKDEDQVKDISYTVKYFIENKEQESDRKVVTETVWINAEEIMTFDVSLLDKEYVGYKQVRTNPEIVGNTVNNKDVIEVYYEKDEEQVKDISYTVKYFIENKEQESDRKVVTETVWVNAEEIMTFDSSLLNKEYVGYKKINTNPETVGTTVNNKDVIEVYYEKDEEQTKDISYTVKYFIEEVEQEADRKVVTETVWVNDKEEMTFDVSLLNKEYVGYKKVRTNPETVGNTVNNGDIIKVYYEKDEEQVKEISYTVKYFIENKEQEADRKVITQTVWINAEETMAFDSSLLNKEYVGYKKVKTNPETVGNTVNNGDVIKVYYEKDLTQTKTLKYTVKYFLDDVEQEKDKVEKSETVWVNEANTMNFDAKLLEKEYVGYIKIRINPAVIGTTVENGTEVKVYYVTDPNATKDLKYTVKYFLDNVEQEKDKVEKTQKIWINSTENIMQFDSRLLNKEYAGYKKVGTNPETVGATVNNGDIIEVYYEKDLTQTKTLKYTVKYFIDNVEQEDDKVERTKTVWVNEANTMSFDATLLEKEYTGYKKVSTNPAVVGAIVENGIVIKVYYEKDLTQTKTLKYTVKYYLNNVEQEDDKVERTKTVWVNEEDTMEFDATLLDKEYAGYRKVRTNPETIGTIVENGTVIKVYYLKPANITVSKISAIVGKTNAAEKGDKIKYTITAKNTGEEEGTVVIKDADLKTSIDNGLVEFVEKTGYTGTNQELIAALAGNGVSLTVQGNSEVKITYTVKVLAKVGTTIKNKVEVISGGKIDEEKDETINVVEKTATITENTETIKGKNIVIVIDLSASMNDIIGGVSKLEAAKDAAQGFITKIFEKDPNGTSGTKLSLVTFNYGGNEKSSGDTDAKYVGTKVFTYGNNSTIVTNKSQAEAMNSAIEAIELDSDLGTNMGAALIKAEQQLGVLRQGNNNDQVIIFLGDGDPSTGGNENTESAINNKATALKNAGVEIYTIGFGLHQEVDIWCPGILNSSCDKEHYKTSGVWDILSIFRYHKEDVYEENAIRILRNMASGTTSAEKDKYARSSTGAQDLIDTFKSISSSIAIDTDTTQSTNAKIELSSTIYADETHPITIKVNGAVDTTLKVLPTDTTGKVIKEGTKYYLDLTKFDADVEISITYFSK